MTMAHVRKALAAAFGAASGAIIVAAQDGQLTTADWVTIAVAAIATGYLTWQIPNRPPPGVP